MGLFTIFNIVIVVVISFMAFNFFRMFKPLAKYEHVHDEKCEIIKGTFAVEDFVEFGEYLLGAADNRKALWHGEGTSKAENGYIVILNPKTKKITKIPDIEGFPKDIAFHPHGISIHKDNLYVINHAYGKGSERVDVLQVAQDKESGRITLKYLRSFVFGDEFNGMLNDLAVIDNDKFYVTTWKVGPDSVDGPDHGTMVVVKTLLTNLLGLKQTKLFFCDGYDGNKPKFQEVIGGEAHMNNGITLDDTNTYLYVADLFPSLVRKYKINKDYSLTLKKTIDVIVHPDNIMFDRVTKKIYAAGMFDILTASKLMDALNNHKDLPADFKLWAGATSIDTLNDDKVTVEVSQDSFFRGVSVALKSHDSIIIGSFFEDGVMICPLK
jgi:DNA-binding beta-propeller fold protein YncE